MPAAAFLSALPFVLQWEGGYVNHPADPGGATNRGVTQRVYDEWRRGRGLSPRDVRQLADDELHAIYEAGYWTPAHCASLRDPLALVQFDTAVNMGVGRAVRFMQRAVGTDDDGVWGSGSQGCADRCDPASAARAHCAQREAYYRSLAASKPKLAVFLRGWLNRLEALRMAAGLVPRRRGAPAVAVEPTARVPDLGVDADYDLDGDAVAPAPTGTAMTPAAPPPAATRAAPAQDGPIRRAAVKKPGSKKVAARNAAAPAAKKAPARKAASKTTASKTAAPKRVPAKKASTKRAAARKRAG